MANADQNNVVKRSSKNRPLTFAEGDQNLDELINVIDDNQALDEDVNGVGGVDERLTDVEQTRVRYDELNSTTAGEGASLVSLESGDTVEDAIVIKKNSVADMIATDLKVGETVRTLGYYSAGDGGGNDYEIVSGGTGTADGGSFIDLDNGLQARGLFNSGVSLKRFGAVGDGVADDTAKSQSAINYAVSAKMPLDIDPGSYLHTAAVTATLTNGDDLFVIGSGRESANFTCGAHNLFTVTIDEAGDPRGDSVGIRFAGFSAETTALGGNAAIEVTNTNANGGAPIKAVLFDAARLTFTGSGANYWGDAIKLTNISGFDIDRIYVQGQGNGLAILGYAPAPVDARISRMRCYSVDKAIRIQGAAEGIAVDSLVAVACKFGINWISESAAGVFAQRPMFMLTNSHINTSTASATGTAAVLLDGVVQPYIAPSNLLYIGSDDSFGVFMRSSGGTSRPRGVIAASIKNPTGSLNATGIHLADDILDMTIGGRISECNIGLRAPNVAQNGVLIEASTRFTDNTTNVSGAVGSVIPSTTTDLSVGDSANLIATVGKGRSVAGSADFDLYTDTATRGSSFSHDQTHLYIRNFGPGNTFIGNSSGIQFRVEAGGQFNPNSNAAQDLGAPSLRWKDAYSNRFRVGNGDALWTSGNGTPEGAVTAPVGSIYSRLDGGAGTAFYVKESGTGNTGWVAK